MGWIVSRNLQIDYRYGRALVNRSSRFWRDSAPDNTPDLLEARALLEAAKVSVQSGLHVFTEILELQVN